MRKATDEERQLGLDPNLYTKKPWNPGDFIGWSQNAQVINPALKQVADQARIKSQQEQVLGPAQDSQMNDWEKKYALARILGGFKGTLEDFIELNKAANEYNDPGLQDEERKMDLRSILQQRKYEK